MAGHAPDYHPQGNRVLRWLENLSDFRISIYMLVIAVSMGLMLMAIDSRFLE